MVQSKRKIRQARRGKEAQKAMASLFESAEQRRRGSQELDDAQTAKELRNLSDRCFELARNMTNLANKIELKLLQASGLDDIPF